LSATLVPNLNPSTVGRWEFQYGFATLCSGDDYRSATNQMCLVSDALGLALNGNGGAAQSVENAIAASFTINGQPIP
jgi:hypothetical protein